VQRAKGRSIAVNIDSDGGNLEVAIAVYQAMAQHDRRIETRIVGKALSAAAMLAMAGDKRLIARDGNLLFHAPHLELVATETLTAPTLRAVASHIDGLRSVMTQIVAKRAGLPLATARNWVAAGRRFSAATAIQAGVCHGYCLVPASAARRGSVSVGFTRHHVHATVAAWRERMRSRYRRP
jgi:ATP-dependent Clp protease, protease subunit